jgi:hypothetical protein
MYILLNLKNIKTRSSAVKQFAELPRKLHRILCEKSKLKIIYCHNLHLARNLCMVDFYFNLIFSINIFVNFENLLF